MRDRRTLLLAAALTAAVVSTGCAHAPDDYSPDQIIALERGALDRWGKGDPQGYYDIMAGDVSYFDPISEKRLDGLAALKAHVAPFAGKISIERSDLINPQVRRDGNIAILTFNLVDTGAQIAGGPKGTARWNSTEVYQRLEGKWKIVHSHWSYTVPELKSAG